MTTVSCHSSAIVSKEHYFCMSQVALLSIKIDSLRHSIIVLLAELTLGNVILLILSEGMCISVQSGELNFFKKSQLKS